MKFIFFLLLFGTLTSCALLPFGNSGKLEDSSTGLGEAVSQIKAYPLSDHLNTKVFDYNSKVQSLSSITKIDKFINSREVTIFKPKYFTPNSNTSILISFHGFLGSRVQQNWLIKMIPHMRSKNFILVLPKAIGDVWDFNQKEARDFLFVEGLMNSLQENYKLGSEKIFLVGHNNGAILAANVACKTKRPLGGMLLYNGFTNFVKCSNPVSTVLVNSSKDEVLDYQFAEYSFDNMVLRTHKCKAKSDSLDLALYSVQYATECTNDTFVSFYSMKKTKHLDPLPDNAIDHLLNELLGIRGNEAKSNPVNC